MIVVAFVGSMAMHAAAAPHGDYFSDMDGNTQETSTTFQDWITDSGNSGLAQCDAYGVVFSSDCGSRGDSNNTDNIAGVGSVVDDFENDGNSTNDANQTANNEANDTPSVSVLNEQCINEDGVADFEIENARSYKWMRSGDVLEIVDYPSAQSSSLTFDDLADGKYVLSAINNGNTDSVMVTVGCDEDEAPDDPDGVTGYCSVSPKEPVIGDTVIWSISASGGTGSYSYDWSGDVAGNNATVSTTYSTPGEKEGIVETQSGNDTLTVRCTVDVQEEEEDDGEVRGRTIEEF